MAYADILIIWVIILVIVGVAGYYGYAWFEEGNTKASLLTGLAVVIVLSFSIFFTVGYLNSAGFQRTKRAIVTNYNTSEVYREMKVVGRSGETIYETEGSYDIEFSEGRLRWVDEDGFVQIIYLGESATVVVNEVEKSE